MVQSPGLYRRSQAACSDISQTVQIVTFICENLHTSFCQSGSLEGSLDPCTALAVTYQKLLPCALDEIQVKHLTKVYCTQELKTRLKVSFGPSTGPSITVHTEIWMQSERH